ncbi:stage II sporulation protein E [Tissierella creatinophila DSM 6911]|uniref:Stage II sporulation protein E n=2 Tax=Tissierella creatinophila TaxID=79681 RepID=A0A1U7M6Q3_TISCR|nr:stage II sporulation protein E [Tissierella creatinophila DSM 6911]
MIRMESVTKKRDLEVGLNDIMLVFIGFFISRVSILNELTPFGIAFLGTYLLMKRANAALLISVIFGMFTIHGFSGSPYYIIAIISYYIFTNILREKEYTLLKSSFILSQIFLSIRILTFILFEKVLLYNMFVIGFESVLVFTLSYIFSFSLPIEKMYMDKANKEKLACTFITMALVLSGFNNMEILGVSLKNILSIMTIIYFSYYSGILMGVTSGVIIGMIAFISNTEMPFIISILAAGGLLAGLFRDLGKSGSILGFILGNGIISFYINSLGTSFLDYRELFIASIMFLIASKFIKIDLEDYFIKTSHIKKYYENKKDEIAIKRLNEMESLFKGLAEVLNRSIDEEVEYPSVEVYSLIDDISKKTCEGCPSSGKCWGTDYYNTYYNILNLVNKLGNGEDKEKVFHSIEECENKDSLIENIMEIYSEFKENKSFNIKHLEHRKLLAEQMENLSKIINDMGNDFYSTPIFNEELEELILKELKNKRMDIASLSVIELQKGEKEVLVEMASNIESFETIEAVRKEVTKNLGFPLSTDYTLGNLNGDKRSFKLVRKKRFNSLTTISKSSNSEDEICGDSYTFGERENIHFSAISDGMGIGKKAHKESSIAIELLEKLMDINMDKNLIIKTLNSVLRAKSTDEIFTTLDLSFIDLYTGKLQIIKNGCPATFIKRGKEVKVINSSSLPIGILEDIHLNIYEEELQDGDIVIMMSDGLIESNRREKDQEKWMKDCIGAIDSLNPKTIINEILNIAQFVGKDNPQDDMTIIATKIWKNV